MSDWYHLTRLRAAGLWAGRLLSGALLLAAVPVAAQSTARRAAPQERGVPMMIDLRQGPANAAPGVAEKSRVLREQLALTSADDLRLVRTETDELGFVHERLQPYYLGVKVEHATISLHERGGKIEMLSGDYERPSAGASATPALTERVALQRAVGAIGARRYMWQDPAEEVALKQQTQKPDATYQPKGELVWVGDFRQPEANRPVVLAWKFNIYAAEPVSRDWVYIDARTGQMVMRNAIIKHVNSPGATFATRYLGTRTSITDNTGTNYRLRETATGKGVTTLNLRKSTTFSTAIDFIDNDNNWTAAEHNNANFDNAALDAHLGAQITQDYWTNVHGRDSYDDRGSVLLSYVHYGNGTDNAFWDGTAMLYGDGSTAFKPLTAIDVCGHEIGHAVCETTANLVYQNESGALNEGFSDIWGCCVENHLDPTKQVYLIGEDICKPSFGLALRSMSNPNQFSQPDTYLGTNWATGAGDNGGVHTNSGVLNFWFYLLSNGGSGTNDNGTAYNVTGISIAKAGFIAYRAERLYMTTTTNYAGARKATMQAAVDLYGLGSAEVANTARAWRAVGLGEGTPTLTSFSPTSGLSGTVVTLTGTNLGTTLSVTFNGTPATIATLTSSTSVAVTVPPGATTGPIVVTTSGGSATSASNFTITAAGPSPVITSFTPAAGQVQGGSVTITGTSFTGATGVSFNGVAAAFTVVNATTITTTVPGTATTGALTVTTANGTATAPTTFTVLPNITSFTPTSAIAGASVVITGTSFTGALTVKFNGTYATSFTVNSATQITAVVAAGTTTGPITVRTPSGTATSATNFTLTPSLAFTSFSPTSGAPGTVVNIQGRGFTGTTAVTFGGVNAPTFTVASDLELWATVPTGGQTGNIVLTTPLGPATSPSAFTVIIPGAPTITSFTPTSGPVGTGVTITGTNFTGATAVAFNGTAATFSVLNATTITTTVPAGATNGPISVTTPVNGVVSSTNFSLPPTNDLCTGTLPTLTCGGTVTGSTVGASTTGDPTATCVTSITAPGVFYRFTGTGALVTLSTCGATTTFDTKLHVFTGTCGSYVCVTGNDDTACGSQGNVSSVTFSSVVGTDYLVFVSGFNSTTGPFILSATCVPPPTITSFTPTSGASGTVVTITGTNFTGATAVRFNGATATSFTVNSSTEIVATVSTTATTGLITVVTPAGTATSATNFTISVGAPTITSFTPTTALPGTTVTLTGNNFSGTLTVNFNGTPAIFSVTTNTSMTTTVPFGSTTGPISVTTPIGTATSATNFTPIVPPANDLCTGTLPVLTCGSSVTGTTINATSNGDPVTTCVTSITAPGVFYRFTGNGALVTLSTCGATTTFDTKLHVFTGTCGSYVCITGNDDTACGSQTAVSSVSFLSVVGTDYLVFVSGFNSNTGPFVLGATCVSAPTITSFSPTSGLPGASVTISGTDFTGATAVRFNGTTATFAVVNATTITATVPATATTGTLSVTTPAGTGTSAATFTVLVPPPAITSFTPTSGPIGATVTLTGTGFTGTSAVRFNGTVAAFTLNSSTSITTNVPFGATTGPISVTNGIGTGTSATNFTVTASPANDLCSAPSLPVLTCGTSVTGSTVNATTIGDPTATCVTSISAPGVFYRFVGTGGSVTMTTCGATTTFDSKLYVFTGTCGNYVCVTGNDDTACGSQTTVSSVTFNSVFGTNYFIFVAGFSTNTGPFILNTTCVPVTPTITSFSPTSGLEGTSVAITGTNLTAASAVRFNGTAATTFTVNSATSITASVPVGATTGPISVTVPGGTGASVTNFRVLHAPVIGPQTFSLTENTANSDVVGTVTASDPDASETLSYAITAGNTGGAFSFTGNQLVVANTSVLDFETNPTFSLTVQVTDNGPTPQSATATVTVNLTNVNEGPSISPQTFSTGENPPNGNLVGLVVASDPDASTTLTYSITAGNTGGAFSFNASTNQLQVANSAPIDFETNPTFSLTVQVSDGTLTSSATVTINVTNVNEAPSISPQTFAIAENSANGTAVGAVAASDPDAGTTLTYSITAGNTGGAFSFGSNGQLQVANSAALDFETTPTFSLTVQVSDGSLTSSATVTVNLSDIVEDLIVSTTAPVAGGSYHNITVTPTGVATLAGAVTYDGALTVQTGGVFDDGCQVLSGPGTFTLQTGATMRVCHAQGLATTGATGAVQVTGARSFASAATYIYTGTAPQVTGLGLPATVEQLSVENPTSVTLSRDLSIRRQLTLAGAGNLAPSDFVLTLLSDATGTAFVVNAGSGVVSGQATVQRYLTPGSATGLGYRHLSAPVTNTRVSDLTVVGTNGFMPVVNAAYNTAPVPTNVRPYPTIFGFDETRGGAAVTDFSRGYFSPTALNSPLVPGRGYSVYMKPLTPDFVGTLGNGNVTMAGLTHTGPGNVGGQKPGWHLLGNPYPAPIDWDLVTVPVGMDAGISVFQSTGGNNGIYLSRANGLGTLPDGLVAMGQGFFARVTGADPVDFTFTNAYRVTSYANPNHFRAAPEARPVLTLTLHATGASSEETDEATVYFETGATAAADAQFDGVKPARNVGVPTLVSLTPNSEELAINGLSTDALTTGLTVPLLLDVPAAGTYELAVQKLMNFGTAPIALLDRLTGTRYDLTTAPVVTYTAQQAGEARNRFALIIGTMTTAAPKLALWPNPAHHAVRVTLPVGTEAVTILDATGRTVRTQPAATTTDLTVDLAGLPAGVYVVKAGAATARLVVE